ncbi:sensor histidine kinase [Paenibacillus chibensis]|uniref:histidine kinase n=1 Tax=Paenibacillus chibensis TaxID=59846 RepID=A0ABU6PX91_9BACL|nr:sensor histidine kinase [Paenibacillus chibensis]
MKLFLKEQLPLTLFYVLQLILVGLWYLLADERHSFSDAAYGALLSLVILGMYLFYRFYRHKKMYARLERPLGQMDQSLNELDEAPLAEAVSDLLRAQFQLYRTGLYDTQQKLDNHAAFINRWVHHMKTPVSVIQLSLQDMDLDDPAADGLQEEIDRLKKGLEMALYTSRLDKFEQDFKVEGVPLLDAVEKSIADNRQWFIRKGVYPEMDIHSDLIVITDAKWLEFMLGQVMDNAVKYSAETGKKVIFKAWNQNSKTLLEIRDEGIGIAKEDLGRVFDPYFTGNQGRHYHESTGMGLYLVREVSHKLGHLVEIESEQGEGTTVRFVFDR